jgi:hypothetical protein
MKNINSTTDMKTTIETIELAHGRASLEGAMKLFAKSESTVIPAWSPRRPETGIQAAKGRMDPRLRHSGMTTWVMTALSILVIASGSLQAAGKGTSGAQFLRIGVGARGPAMSGAVSPIVDDASAIYYNPAGMSRMDRREVEVAYNAYFKDSAAQFLGYAQPTAEHGTFGVGVSLFGVKDIEKRSATGGDADSADLGNFNTQDMALSFGWANKRDLGQGKLRYGAALKYISSDLDVKTAVTGAVDMGAMWDLREDGGLTLSLAVLNLGGKLKFESESDPLPLSVKPGVAYRMDMKRLGKLTLAMDADMMVHDGTSHVQPAFEWAPVAMFSLRGGYQFGRDSDAGNGMSVGAGFNVMNLKIDYAFVPFGDLGDTHRVSLGYKF